MDILLEFPIAWENPLPISVDLQLLPRKNSKKNMTRIQKLETPQKFQTSQTIWNFKTTRRKKKLLPPKYFKTNFLYYSLNTLHFSSLEYAK